MNQPTVRLRYCQAWLGDAQEPECFTRVKDFPSPDNPIHRLAKYITSFPGEELTMEFFLYWSEKNQRYESADGKIVLTP